MATKQKSALLESTKEFLRIEVAAIIPIIIMALEEDWGWKAFYIATGIAALKAVDKFFYQESKNDPTDRTRGLIPF